MGILIYVCLITFSSFQNPFDVQPQGGSDFGSIRRTSSGSASPFAQPPSTNLMDDLSSIFGGMIIVDFEQCLVLNISSYH